MYSILDGGEILQKQAPNALSTAGYHDTMRDGTTRSPLNLTAVETDQL